MKKGSIFIRTRDRAWSGKLTTKLKKKKAPQRCGERRMKDAKSEGLATRPLLSHVVINSFSNPSKGACRYSCEVIWGVHHLLLFLYLSNGGVLINTVCLLLQLTIA
jgi:hypothetical protein